jgi:predicted nucleic acid-binding protein
MCAILDANSFSKFRDQDNEDLEPVRNWVDNKNGKIIYTDTEKFKSEWLKGGMKEQLRALTQAGKLRRVEFQEVEKKADELRDQIESDDPHIIALAIVADVKVLVSSDQALHQDFKNRNLVGGRVYQNEKHAHLLTKDTCP